MKDRDTVGMVNPRSPRIIICLDEIQKGSGLAQVINVQGTEINVVAIKVGAIVDLDGDFACRVFSHVE